MTCVRFQQMDAGLQAAVVAAGGARKLARALGLKEPGLPWATVPQDRVFQVARAAGVPPEQLRPDLADWIEIETERRQLAQDGAVLSLATAGEAIERRWDGPTIEEGVVDLLTTLAAIWFVARLRGLKVPQVYSGAGRAEQSARAFAMGLAKVVGRARSTNIAQVFDVSRQNVDNATERYLRARDGDDPDDFITGQFSDGAPRVLERGANRLRHAKSADESLWPIEERFAAFIGGDPDQLPQPERRRT